MEVTADLTLASLRQKSDLHFVDNFWNKTAENKKFHQSLTKRHIKPCRTDANHLTSFYRNNNSTNCHLELELQKVLLVMAFIWSAKL